MRQRPSRYTIRAGRNLPDKEFRYLRTVIVTAAVYRGFGSELLPERITPFLNLPAPGRCQPLYIDLMSSQRPVFLVNSRLGLFTAIPICFGSIYLHKSGHPFFRSYGAILPSSLTRVLSSALGFSPHLPVSVCGTDTHLIRFEGYFLVAWCQPVCPLRGLGSLTLLEDESSTSLDAHFQPRDGLTSYVTPKLKHKMCGAGIFYPAVLRLRPSAST